MGEFSVRGQKGGFAEISTEELKSAGISGENLDKLKTLFDEANLDVNFDDGIDAKEAQAIAGLFDTNDNDNLEESELSSIDLTKLVGEDVGSKYAKDGGMMYALGILIATVTGKFSGGSGSGGVSAEDFTTKDDNGNITGGYKLETKDGVTSKIRYKADGTVNDSYTETWGEGFKDYRKEWRGPNGEKAVLEATGEVTRNEDGTYNVVVKKVDGEHDPKTFTLVLDENGNEIRRFDNDGKEYDAYGAEKPAAADDCPDKDEEMQVCVVDAWGTGNRNDCLSRIIMNAYGVKSGTDEYYQIEELVMNANPEIYGDENGNGGRNRLFDGSRHNAVIHPGDNIKLPAWNGTAAEVNNTPESEIGTRSGESGGTLSAARMASSGPRTDAPAEMPPDEPPLASDPPPASEPDPAGDPDDNPTPANGLTKYNNYWIKTVRSDGVVPMVTTTLYYDAEGKHPYSVTVVDEKNGTTLETLYDRSGNPTKLTSQSGNGNYAIKEFYTTGNNNVKKETVKKGGKVTVKEYNSNGKITKETVTENGKTTTTTYEYKGGNCIALQETDSGYTQTVLNSNNRCISKTLMNKDKKPLSKTEYGSDGKTVKSTTTYTYNKSGNLEQEVVHTLNDKAGNVTCPSVLTITYQYSDGKLIGSKAVKTYGGGNFNNSHGWTEIRDVNGRVVKWSNSNTWVGQNIGPWNKPSGEHV